MRPDNEIIIYNEVALSSTLHLPTSYTSRSSSRPPTQVLHLDPLALPRPLSPDLFNRLLLLCCPGTLVKITNVLYSCL